MTRIFLLALVVLVSNCDSQKKQPNQIRQSSEIEINDTSFLSISQEDLNTLKSVSINRRGDAKYIVAVTISVGDDDFVIPTCELDDSASIKLKIFKMYKFAKKIGHDTTNIVSYADSITKQMLRVFRSANVKQILSGRSNGDFTIFRPKIGYEYVYRFSSRVDSDSWKKYNLDTLRFKPVGIRFSWKTFFDTALVVRPNWYRGFPIDNTKD